MRRPGNVPCLGVPFPLFSALTVILVFGAGGYGEDGSNWDKVKRLSAGQEILVVQKDAKSFQGKLQSVSDETVVIRLATGEQTLAKGSVVRVSTRGASHRWRNVALGAGVGFGGGAGIGAAAANPNGFGHRSLGAAVGAVFGLVAGAAVGAVLPTGGWHAVYRTQ